MNKILTLAFALGGLLQASSSYATIYGTLGVCVGNSSTLYDSSGSMSSTGTWSSSNATVASVGPTTGIVTGHTPGTAIITFTGTTSTSTAVFTVNPAPSAIAGTSMPFCAGTTSAFTCATVGGVWSSSPTSVATVSSTTGVVTGVGGGTATIYYTIGTGCSASRVVTVMPLPWVDSILGVATTCVGGTTTLTSATAGGNWTSSLPGVATVGASTGVVTGVSAGTAAITYSVTNSCGTSTRVRLVTVTSGTSAGTISGASTVMTGLTATYTATVGGGTWTSSTPAVATISSTGVVTGVAAGTATISYAVSGCSGVAYATAVVTVTAANCISGDVVLGSTAYHGNIKIWLIKYNPATHMLYAVDSTVVYCAGATTTHYSFCGMGTDSFRVKAACTDSLVLGGSTTGYQPTYHTASAYWHSATVINHVAGTHDMGKNINMGYGTLTSGPGFIAGDVTTGANKGTADAIPAVGLLVYCVNSTTGTIMQQTFTNASGHFTFSNLPVGATYKIYPELMNYATTPYPAITLTSGAASMTAANFEQHTVSYTITPITTGVSDMATSTGSISLYPNPASSVLNVSWGVENAGTASVTIADVTGRTVLATAVDMGARNGNAGISLANVAKGVYLITIRANGVNYNSKVVVE